MDQTLPTSMSSSLPRRYATKLAAATWADLVAQRDLIVERGLAGWPGAPRLLPLVTAEMDRRPEGQAAASARIRAMDEGHEQLRRRRGTHYQLQERDRRTNQRLWSSPVHVNASDAHHVFHEQARRLGHQAGGATRLVLKEDRHP